MILEFVAAAKAQELNGIMEVFLVRLYEEDLIQPMTNRIRVKMPWNMGELALYDERILRRHFMQTRDPIVYDEETRQWHVWSVSMEDTMAAWEKNKLTVERYVELYEEVK